MGISTIQTVCVGVAPMPMAASFMREGTMRMASSEVRMMVGNMRMESAMAPAMAEYPPVVSTMAPYARRPPESRESR